MWPARMSARTCEAGMPNSRLRSFESKSCISSASGLACGGLGNGPLGLLALFEARRLRSARVDARAQRLHEIDHIAAGGRDRSLCERDLTALDLLLDGGFHSSLELIVVFVGIETFGGKMVDELLSELELGLGNLGRLDAQILEVAHLGLEMELVQRESVLHRPDHHDVLLASGDPAAHRALTGLAQRRGEKRIGF